MPITWKNVDSRDDTVAASLMTSAQKSFNTGMQGFTGIIEDEQARVASNRAIVGDNNDVALQSLYAKYKTPEELQAAQQSGEIDAMKQSFGGNYNRKAALAMGDERRNVLFTQQDADRVRQESKDARASAGVLDTFQAALVGDNTGATVGTDILNIPENLATLQATNGLAAARQMALDDQNKDLAARTAISDEARTVRDRESGEAAAKLLQDSYLLPGDFNENLLAFQDQIASAVNSGVIRAEDAAGLMEKHRSGAEALRSLGTQEKENVVREQSAVQGAYDREENSAITTRDNNLKAFPVFDKYDPDAPIDGSIGESIEIAMERSLDPGDAGKDIRRVMENFMADPLGPLLQPKTNKQGNRLMQTGEMGVPKEAQAGKQYNFTAADETMLPRLMALAMADQGYDDAWLGNDEDIDVAELGRALQEHWNAYVTNKTHLQERVRVNDAYLTEASKRAASLTTNLSAPLDKARAAVLRSKSNKSGN